MGVEPASNGVIRSINEDDAEEVYFSDSVAISTIIKVLEGVAKASDIDEADKAQYDSLIKTLDPYQRVRLDDELMILSALTALSGAVSRINLVFHAELLHNIFHMSVWNYGVEARNALLELITSLAAVPDKYLDGCLHFLVTNFVPPEWLRRSTNHPRWAEKRKIHDEIHRALHYIADVVPFAPERLKDTIDKNMPRASNPKEVIVLFVECMLGLENYDIAEFLGSTLLAKLVDLLTELDVNITWEDILHEEHKGIFDIELEDADLNENANEFIVAAKRTSEETEVLKGNVYAEKLDSLMVITCEHLKSCAYDGHLTQVFEILTNCFRRSVLNTYKSKFAQFIMFYACSLDPENCGKRFADRLTDIFISKMEDPNSRMSAVAYLASYLSRARFISSSLVASILKRIVDWCLEYCQSRKSLGISINPKAHRVFYSGCQAAMYILCFRMRSLVDVPHLRSVLSNLPLQVILCDPLDPLKVCLPSIVQEFLQQAKAAHLFKPSTTFLFDSLLESEFSKAFGGVERLDTFFPFDPYLLKESDRFMRPNFEFWYMVKTTYSDCNSDDDEDEDLDVPEFVDNADLDSEDEDLEYSMNKMSITPKPAFRYAMASNLPIPSGMPARIGPSLSPDW